MHSGFEPDSYNIPISKSLPIDLNLLTGTITAPAEFLLSCAPVGRAGPALTFTLAGARPRRAGDPEPGRGRHAFTPCSSHLTSLPIWMVGCVHPSGPPFFLPLLSYPSCPPPPPCREALPIKGSAAAGVQRVWGAAWRSCSGDLVCKRASLCSDTLWLWSD